MLSSESGWFLVHRISITMEGNVVKTPPAAKIININDFDMKGVKHEIGDMAIYSLIEYYEAMQLVCGRLKIADSRPAVPKK
jgi:hypothetical protein